jgi:hypothetical protein
LLKKYENASRIAPLPFFHSLHRSAGLKNKKKMTRQTLEPQPLSHLTAPRKIAAPPLSAAMLEFAFLLSPIPGI